MECGPEGGTRSRAVDCVVIDVTGNATVTSASADQCLQLAPGPRPPASEGCNDNPCETFAWAVLSDWEPARDGVNLRRKVRCLSSKGLVVLTSLCGDQVTHVGLLFLIMISFAERPY